MDFLGLTFALSRSLSEASRRDRTHFGKTTTWREDILEEIRYSINSHGYRSAEFDKNNEILVLGCSQTYGCGMPDEFTWPSIFSNSINKKYSRVAIGGDCITGQVYKAFKYFEEIGNPKIVLALFPMYRFEYISIPEKISPPVHQKDELRAHPTIEIAYHYEDYFLKLSKAPHFFEHITPKEFIVFYNFMFIKMLEQYCESHGIKFIWSIYEDTNLKYEKELTEKNIMRNHLKTFDLMWLHLRDISTCPFDRQHCAIEHKNNKLYNYAADYQLPKGHWGIHLHSHIANRFLERYENIK